jgi:hypothetical protein
LVAIADDFAQFHVAMPALSELCNHVDLRQELWDLKIPHRVFDTLCSDESSLETKKHCSMFFTHMAYDGMCAPRLLLLRFATHMLHALTR